LTRIYQPAICGDDDITWKSTIALSIWSTFVVWPRRIVKKYDDGLGGGALVVVFAAEVGCWSVCGGIPPENIINGSPLDTQIHIFR
jgi:hypothetical protein